MTERAEVIKCEHFFFTECFGQPIVVIPKGEMERLCEYAAKLEAENADLRLKVEELGALCNRKTRQCCHKDRIISSLDLELAALKRELAGEMEKH